MAGLGGHFEWARLPGGLRAVALKPPGSSSHHVEMLASASSFLAMATDTFLRNSNYRHRSWLQPIRCTVPANVEDRLSVDPGEGQCDCLAVVVVESHRDMGAVVGAGF